MNVSKLWFSNNMFVPARSWSPFQCSSSFLSESKSSKIRQERLANRETRVACTRGRKTRSRALYSMTHKAQTSFIDFVSLLGAKAYYRLFFVKVEHHRHAMNFSSIALPETGQLISKPFYLTLCCFLGPSGKKPKSTELFWHCILRQSPACELLK